MSDSALEQAQRRRRAGDRAGAEADCRAVLAAAPDDAAAHLLLASLLVDMACLEEAVLHFHETIRLSPGSAAAHAALGQTLETLGREGEAESSYRQALHLHPGFAEVHNDLGLLLRGRDKAAAETEFRAALAAREDFTEAANNLAAVLCSRRAFEEAEILCRRALALRPNYVPALIVLGNALSGSGKRTEAERSCRQVLDLAPDHVEAHNNLGILLNDLGRVEEGIAHLRAALRKRPDYADGHYNLSLSLLRAGKFEPGWQEFEWRLGARRQIAERHLAAPLWDGGNLDGRTLLIHAEEGFGDTLQFCRFVQAAGRTGRVILEVPPALVRLLSTLPGAAEIVGRGKPLPPFDCRLPMLSLPHRLGIGMADLPGDIPYLRADAGLAAYWAERLARLDGIKVGFVWAGNPDLPADGERSIDPEILSPLGSISGVSFVSLQERRPRQPRFAVQDWTAELGDFADTAALIDGLDLVIGVDTAIVHLAGAMGKPAWLLNRFNTCWRWLLDRDDSPWYPTLRQFRQSSLGDWGGVVDRVAAALADRVLH